MDHLGAPTLPEYHGVPTLSAVRNTLGAAAQMLTAVTDALEFLDHGTPVYPYSHVHLELRRTVDLMAVATERHAAPGSGDGR